MIFEYVERNLLEVLEASPDGLPLAQIKEIIYQLLKAVDFLHSHGIIH